MSLPNRTWSTVNATTNSYKSRQVLLDSAKMPLFSFMDCTTRLFC